MFSKKENIYFGVMGTLGFLTMFLLTFYEWGDARFNLTLFILLAVVGLVLEKIFIKIGDFTITLDTLAMLCSYVLLGLVPTLWLISILILVYGLLFEPVSKRKTYSNTGMFIIMFALSHLIFSVLGLEMSSVRGIQGIIVFSAFVFCVFLINWTFIFFQYKARNNGVPEAWLESFIWDFYSNLVVIPLSLLFIQSYRLYGYLGPIGCSSVVVFSNILFRLVRNLVFINNELKVVQKVSVSISSRLDLSETTDNIIVGISELVDCDYCSFIELDKVCQSFKTNTDKAFGNLHIDSHVIDDYLTNNIREFLSYKESFIVANVKKSKILKDKDDIPQEIKSIIYEPLLLENEVIGCILVCSAQENKFAMEKLKALDILASQAAIAIENARMYKDAQNKAIKDALTGLYNQRYFYQALEHISNKCHSCHRDKCIGCNRTSLIIFDIDHFKLINDTYGHQTGDKILSDIAFIIASNVRGNDIVSRYGGEEFTVILPQTDQVSAYSIAERIRSTVEKTEFYSIDGNAVRLTISGGVSQYPEMADSGPSLLAHADRAMYIGSKRQGRNRISTYVS